MLRQLSGLLLFSVYLTACVSGQAAEPTSVPTSEPTIEPTIEIEEPANPEDQPTNSAYLMTIDAVGGLCIYGLCHRRTEIYQDGFARITEGEDEEVITEGMLDTATLEILIQAIYGADFEQIRSQPFTDTCPTAYDGQEYIFTFYNINSGEESVSSCEFVLNTESSLFRTDYESLIASQ